jgi:hypothetical protein
VERFILNRQGRQEIKHNIEPPRRQEKRRTRSSSRFTNHDSRITTHDLEEERSDDPTIDLRLSGYIPGHRA